MCIKLITKSPALVPKHLLFCAVTIAFYSRISEKNPKLVMGSMDSLRAFNALIYKGHIRSPYE